MHASRKALIGTSEDAQFSDRHSGIKPSRDSTFGEDHISYMKKIGAVFHAFRLASGRSRCI